MIMCPLSEENLDILTDISWRIGCDLRPYSGRGMHGKKCIAIVCDQRTYTLFIAEVAKESTELADDLCMCPTSDDMGLSTVYYWPNIPCPPDLEDVSDDDEEEPF